MIMVVVRALYGGDFHMDYLAYYHCAIPNGNIETHLPWILAHTFLDWIHGL